MSLVKGSFQEPLRVAGEHKDVLKPDDLAKSHIARFKIDDQVFHVIPQTFFARKFS